MAVDITIRVPAVEKLIDHTSSGMGAAFATLFAPVSAWLKGKAAIIEARHKAGSLPVIAEAQAEARKRLIPADVGAAKGVVDIAEVTRLSVRYQQKKRMRNVESVVWNAAAELGDEQVMAITEIPHLLGVNARCWVGLSPS